MTFVEVRGDRRSACWNPVWCCCVSGRPSGRNREVNRHFFFFFLLTNPPRAACTPTSRWPWTSRCFVAMTTQLVAILLCHCGSIIFCSSAETFGGRLAGFSSVFTHGGNIPVCLDQRRPVWPRTIRWPPAPAAPRCSEHAPERAASGSSTTDNGPSVRIQGPAGSAQMFLHRQRCWTDVFGLFFKKKRFVH